MTDLTDVLPPKNHNNPPSELEMLGESLTIKYVHTIRQAQEHIALAKNVPDHFTEENEATWTTDFIKLMQNAAKHVEGLRKAEKEPFLRQGQYVDSFFNELIDGLTSSVAKAKRPLDDWLKRKADSEQAVRIADAKLLREQQEAAFLRASAMAQETREERGEAVQAAIELTDQVKVAESIAAAPVNSMASTQGTSARAGLASKWVATIVDVDQLELVKLRPYIPVSELQKALDRYVKQGGRQCAGAEIKEIFEAKVK